MHDADRTANLLGAAVLAIGDLVRTETASAAGTSASGAAALVVLADAPDLSGTELGRRIGLSQPAAARMVDGLAGAGLVRRQRGSGKSVAIRLTDAGRAAADRALAARHEALAGSIAGLDPARQTMLAELLCTVLDRVYDRIGSADLICRLCDRAACVARQASCPVGTAQRERGAQAQPERSSPADGRNGPAQGEWSSPAPRERGRPTQPEPSGPAQHERSESAQHKPSGSPQGERGSPAQQAPSGSAQHERSGSAQGEWSAHG